MAFARRFEVRALSQRVIALGLEEILDVSEPHTPAPPNQWGPRSPGDVVSQAGPGLILRARSPLTHARGTAAAEGALRRLCEDKRSKTTQVKCAHISAQAS